MNKNLCQHSILDDLLSLIANQISLEEFDLELPLSYGRTMFRGRPCQWQREECEIGCPGPSYHNQDTDTKDSGISHVEPESFLDEWNEDRTLEQFSTAIF